MEASAMVPGRGAPPSLSSLPSELLVRILHYVYADPSDASQVLNQLWALRRVSKRFCACVEQTFKELHIRHTYIHFVTQRKAGEYVRSTFHFDRFVDGEGTCAVLTYLPKDTNDQSDEELRLLIEDWKRAMIYDLPEKRPYLLQVWNVLYEVDLPSLRSEFGKLQVLVNWLDMYKAFFKVEGLLQRLKDEWSDTMQQELAGLEGRWYSYGFQRRELRIKWEVGMHQYVWRSRLREHYKDDGAKLWAINQIAPLEERPPSHTDDGVSSTHRTMYIHLRLCQEDLTAKIRNNVFAVGSEAA